MRPETMEWHDAADIADFPGDIDGTDETTAAPGMVFTPQTAADTNQDQRTDHDDGSRQTATQYDSSAPESTVNQPHTSGVAVAAFADPQSDEALLAAFDPHNMLTQDTYVPIQFDDNMSREPAAGSSATFGVSSAGRPDVDALAISGVGTVPDTALSVLSNGDVHAGPRTSQRHEPPVAVIVLACCAPILLAAAIAAQFVDHMLIHYVGWLLFVDGIGIPAAILAMVTIVRQRREARYHRAAASVMIRAVVVLVVALVAVGLVSRDIPPLLTRHEVQFVPTQLTSGQHGLFSSRQYEVKGYDPVTGAGVVLRITKDQFAACHAAIPPSSDAGTWRATAHTLPHSGAALDLTCSIQNAAA